MSWRLLFVYRHSHRVKHAAALKVFAKTNDGFALAEEDARLRGLGEFFGTRQHGLGDLRFGDPIADREILEKAREDAIALVAEEGGLMKPEHPRYYAHEVLERYGGYLGVGGDRVIAGFPV